MARNKDKVKREKKKAKGENKPAEISESVRNHIRGFGFSVADYKKWCKDNGFRSTLNKSYHDLSLERLYVARSRADSISKEHRKVRSPKRAIAAYLAGNADVERHVPFDVRNALCYYATSGNKGCEYEALVRLIQHVNKHTDLLDNKCSPYQRKSYVHGILALAKWHKEWVRPIEEWRPKTHNPQRRFSSLARHLFAKYDVPLFMDECWFIQPEERQLWFIHIGIGNNPRQCLEMIDDGHYPVSKVKFTKKESHHFMQAPGKYSINDALRWGQIHALGGDSHLADAVIETRLSNEWKNNEFWMSVFRFFIQNPMLDRNQVGPIIDYIQYQRFTVRREMVERGVWKELDPAQPNFSMHHRDPEALLAAVEKWHVGLGRMSRGRGVMDWEPVKGIVPLELSMGEGNNHKVWKIDELLSSDELRAEGTALGHCVFSYDQSCASGRCSIWSMRCFGGGSGRKSRLTIEVTNGCIRQARGLHNAKATEQQKKILEQWASKNGLTIAGCT